MPMHCGLRDNIADFRKCVRSIRIDPLSSFLYWRMNWHMEHHMYAGVPCYNLRKLSRAIAADCPAAAYPDRRVARNARRLEAAARRTRLPVRYAGADRGAGAGRVRCAPATTRSAAPSETWPRPYSGDSRPEPPPSASPRRYPAQRSCQPRCPTECTRRSRHRFKYPSSTVTCSPINSYSAMSRSRQDDGQVRIAHHSAVEFRPGSPERHILAILSAALQAGGWKRDPPSRRL